MVQGLKDKCQIIKLMEKVMKLNFFFLNYDKILIIYFYKEIIIELMEDNIKDNGEIIWCMEKVLLYDQMVKNI